MSKASFALEKLQRELGDLLASHERARDIDSFGRYADDPVGFIRDVLGGEPWSGQIEIAQSGRDHPLTAVRSCNAAGKDWVSAALALWWVYARGGLVLLTGPTERQVREIVMSEVARFWMRSGELPGELFQMALRLGRDDSRGILAFTSTEASKLTGFHAPRVLAIATEAQACEDWTFEGLLSCATGVEDRVLVVGNPLEPSGKFFQVCRSKNWNSIRLSAFDHPNLRENRLVIPGGVTRQWVDRMAEEYGRDSGIYKSRVLGEFPEQAEEGLIRREWLDAAARRWEGEEFWAEDCKREALVSVDVARYGPDSTVAALRRGRTLVRFESWAGHGTTESAERVEGLCLSEKMHPRYKVTAPGFEGAKGLIVVDEVGVGGGVLDDLRKRRWKVRGFNGGRKAIDSERFRNRRTESYWHLRKLLENEEIAIPHDEVLFEELLATNWGPTQDGKIAIPDKDTIKSKLGRSPDRADALTMAFEGEAARMEWVPFRVV